MKNKSNNRLHLYFVKQHNQSWCGLACLSMVCKYYGGEFPQEKLVKMSGTNVSGSTLLGLYQAAQALGLAAEGLEGNTEELAKLKHPAILHTVSENGLLHYVLYLGMDGEKFIIADPAKDMERLIIGTSILAVLLFIKNAAGYYRGILSARQVRDFSNRIVNQFYNIVLYLPKSFFDSLKTGEITARLNDASRIQRTINYISGTFIIDLITIVVVTVFLFVYWWPAAVLTLVASGLFAFIFLRNAQKILSGQQKMMGDYAQSESFFFNSVQGVDVIKSFGKEGVFSNSAKAIFTVFQNSIFDLAILGNKIGFQTQNIAVAQLILPIRKPK